MKRIATHILIGLCSFLLQEAAAQAVYKQTVPPLANEKWWGGLVGIAHQMPYASETSWEDLSRNNYNNQVVPLMVSSEGRYIWSEQPFRYRFSGDTLYIQSEYERPEVVQAGSTLREAYLAASKAHFPPSGQIPEEIFFSKPQYNTWIELMYNQNQPDIMNYAKQVGKPVMVDFTGWGCVNCREMESKVWIDPKVRDIMTKDYVLISLYVDEKEKLPEKITVEENGQTRILRTIGDKWSYLQRVKFGANAQPFYVLLDNEGKPLNGSYSHDEDVEKYINFLQTGLDNYKKKNQ